MTPNELANALVAAGILLSNGNGRFRVAGHEWDELTEEDAINDPRVAMACMERLITTMPGGLQTMAVTWHPELNRYEVSVAKSAIPVYGAYLDRSDESMERAICEAFVAATKDSK